VGSDGDYRLLTVTGDGLISRQVRDEGSTVPLGTHWMHAAWREAVAGLGIDNVSPLAPPLDRGLNAVQHFVVWPSGSKTNRDEWEEHADALDRLVSWLESEAVIYGDGGPWTWVLLEYGRDGEPPRVLRYSHNRNDDDVIDAEAEEIK
jgi:hypothetical protein